MIQVSLEARCMGPFVARVTDGGELPDEMLGDVC